MTWVFSFTVEDFKKANEMVGRMVIVSPTTVAQFNAYIHAYRMSPSVHVGDYVTTSSIIGDTLGHLPMMQSKNTELWVNRESKLPRCASITGCQSLQV